MAEGKKIYAFGDFIRDTILIANSKKGDGNRTGGHRERLTRNTVGKCEVECGITVLKGLFKEFSEDDLSDLDVCKDLRTVSETISEWEEGDRKEEEGHYYLKQQTGYSKNDGEKTTVDLSEITTDSVVAVYNMESKQYMDKNRNPVRVEDIADALTKTSACVIRSGWIAPGAVYSTEKPTGKADKNKQSKSTDLLLEILGKGADAKQKNAILVVNVDELRRCGYNIREGISWEQIVSETRRAVEKTKIDGKQITECCKAVLICIEREGCLLFYQGKTYLFYYCDKIEGDFVREKNRAVFGTTSVMQAAITQKLFETKPEADEEKALCDSVKCGLILMHELLSCGYKMVSEGKLDFPYKEIAKAHDVLTKDQKKVKKLYKDDAEKLLAEFAQKKSRIIDVKFEEGDFGEDKNGITKRLLRIENGSPTAKGVLSECQEFVRNGIKDVKIPYLKLGNLITFDREEIEHIRSIRRIVEQYKDDFKQNTPLSICVFGRPGSGKSFAVKQIVESLGVKKRDIFEFNLSQMTNLRDLYAAFHQVRDAGLRGGLPVAFFDEFDASIGDAKLAWLKYFLAPMQDGEFRENGMTHYIGKALFVFAGGTHQTMEELHKKQTDMVEQKLPDFISRIKGFIDVAGPNALPCPVAKTGKVEDCWRKVACSIRSQDGEQFHSCPYVKKCCQDYSQYLRRAALLRSQLQRKLDKKENERIDIDDRVLDAFLLVEEYKHGARSMKGIVDTSHVEPGGKFDVTSIDSNFLDLYATEDFKWYLQQPPKQNS